MLNLRSMPIGSTGTTEKTGPAGKYTTRLLTRWMLVLTLHVALLQTASIAPAYAADDAQAEARHGAELILAQADIPTDPPERSRPLEPRYQPRDESPTWYNGSYIFGMTRSLADSTVAPAAKAPLFLFTIPLDVAFLPFAIIGGLFG